MDPSDRAALAARLQMLAPRLVAATADLAGVHLVGGAVRDLLLDGRPLDLDLVVEGDAAAVARAVAERLGGTVLRLHPRFGTATVAAPDGTTFDLAGARAERYPAPGALPVVRPAPLADDLARRDFTVNAVAAALDATRLGALTAHPGALDDLAARRLRILHERSFLDDPTRLLRLARYAGRLGFEIEPRTARLARAAIVGGAPATVSLARIGDELRLAVREPAAIEVLRRAEAIGLLVALPGPRLSFDAALAERALALLPADGHRDRLLLVGLLRDAPGPDARDWLAALETERSDAAVIVAAATGARALARALRAARDRPSALWAAAAGQPVEAIALAGALGPTAAARRWLDELRHVRLAIDGSDLRGAGVPEGPALGAALRSTLARKLDGELPGGREAELRAAVTAARG